MSKAKATSVPQLGNHSRVSTNRRPKTKDRKVLKRFFRRQKHKIDQIFVLFDPKTLKSKGSSFCSFIVSNESVGFPAFNFAVFLTNNFVVAGSHLENRSLAYVSFVQPTPDIMAEHVQTFCLGRQMSYFILQVVQILFINCRQRFHQ